MKNFIFKSALILTLAPCFTACDNDENEPIIDPVEVSEGLYILNQGNSGSTVLQGFFSKESGS